MADFLLELASNKRARQVVSSLGLPLPMPERLERASEPWQERPLQGRNIVIGASPKGHLADPLAATLPGAGATCWLAADAHWQKPLAEAARAADTPLHGITEDAPGPEERPWALVFDATSMREPSDLRALYDFFHPRIRGIAKSGRLIVLGRLPGWASSPEAAATRQALEGFVRSCGREVGRFGATANLIAVEGGAEDRLPAVLRWMLSPRSAFVSGQPLRVTREAQGSDPVWVRPLEGRVAVVTGAARGIGAAIATAMAQEGATVIVVDRPEDAELGQEVARSVGGRFVGIDITNPDAGTTLVQHLRDHEGMLHILVHNAGITRDKTLAKMTDAMWDLTIDVNLTAAMRLTDTLKPLITPQGRVIAMSSIAGIAGNVGQTNYSASKAGLIGFVRKLASQWASQGVTVNAIAPGFIETRMTAAIPLANREAGRRLSNLAQGGLPEDIASMATFLASPGASGVTGQVLRVCGGSYIGA
ncbi:MAG: 3-oxoacyl-ACP reductase [Myxococcota bacterium]